MHSLWLTGRLLSRAICYGISNYSSAADPNVLRKSDPYIISAVCGFPKERVFKRLIKGQFGDDAWFSTKSKSADVLGVADGVGGWRAYGIDPGEFSMHLMRTCERLVKLGRFTPNNPSDLLARSYYELLHHKKAILGSSTACVIILNRETSTLYTANIGDSGFMVLRDGKVIHRSEEQQHYFNTPFQLSLPPPGYQANVLSDQPDSAITGNFPVEDGDVILVATDGVFDNLPQALLVEELCKVQGERSATRLQTVANSIAWMARNLSFDENIIIGSSTACVIILNRETSTLYTANIGDSGFMVLRDGKVIHRSEEQQHYFNTPFQLSLPPPGYQANVLSDQPDSAITGNFPVEDGDVILVATDGVFDNLPQALLVEELCKVQGERSATRLQTVANSIAWMARNLSFDESFVSPFAESAFANGINTIGGKPDDITVLLATVAI